MPELSREEILEIFYISHQIPIGVFSTSGELIKLYSAFGKRQTAFYLKDCRDIMKRRSQDRDPEILPDTRGSCWCVIPDRETIIFGPVQTGGNPSFNFSGLREYSWDAFTDIAGTLARLLCGRDTNIAENSDLFADQRLADRSYLSEQGSVDLNAFDEIFACVRTGDLKQLKPLLESENFDEYLNRVMDDPAAAETVYLFNLAKTYHTALEGSIPINELSPLIEMYLQEKSRSHSPAALKAGIKRMLYDFTRYVSQYQGSRYSAAVNSAILYIREHLYTSFRIEDIAEHCMISTSGLQHRFREETGMSISEMTLHLRVEKACYFLRHTALPCGDIAYKTGFTSQSYFIKQFRRITGMTPNAYRDQQNRQ